MKPAGPPQGRAPAWRDGAQRQGCSSKSPPIAGLPAAADGPVFGAPWQAQAFAMTLTLHERGVFTWSEWAQALGEQIGAARQQDDDAANDGGAYYRHWLDALAALVQRKGLASAAQLHALEDAWRAAAERTPHGQPIALSPAERALAQRGDSDEQGEE